MKKAELRTLYQQKRAELSINQIQECSRQVAYDLVELLADKPVSYVHIFLPITTGKEVDTWLVIKELQEKKKDVTIVIPRMVSGTRELEHYAYNPDVPLIVNRWGIPEPDPSKSRQILPDQLDVVLIPLLCFDSSGYRVGYGGGYYDRFLAKCKPGVLKIGLSFFEQGPSIEDVDEYDVVMDYLITPSGIHKF